jgi:hypothetical protein
MERKRFEQALNRIEKKIAELSQARGRLTRGECQNSRVL